VIVIEFEIKEKEKKNLIEPENNIKKINLIEKKKKKKINKP